MPTVNIPPYTNQSAYGLVQSSDVKLTSFQDFMEDNLDVIIFDNDCGFAEDVSYTHSTGESKVYTVIVDDPFYDANVGTKTNIAAREMFVRFQESKLLRYPTNKDIAVVRGVKYNVRSPEPDGVGTIILKLQKVGSFE